MEMQTEHNDELVGKNYNTLSSEMQECIENCLNCYRSCEMALAKLMKNVQEDHRNHIKVLQACAQICLTSAKFMIIESKYHHDTCGICSKICADCQKLCEGHPEDWMKECAQYCKTCSESCGEMSKMVM